MTAIAWSIRGKTDYALDGGVYIAGAAVDWLVRRLRLVRSSQETSEIASAVPDTLGVYFVPAFVGLAAPYWDTYTRGTIVGITEGTTKAHINSRCLGSHSLSSERSHRLHGG